MRLIHKTLLVFGAGFLIMTLVIGIVSYRDLIGSFRDLENENTRQQIQVVLRTITNENTTLNNKIGDWSAWDETVVFVQDRDMSYVERNMSPDTMKTLQLNIMVFVDRGGEKVYEMGFDLTRAQEIPVPSELKTYWSANGILQKFPNNETGISGVIVTSQGPLLVVSRPIVATDSQGEISGALVAGRFLNAAEAKRLGEIAGLQLEILPVGSTGLTAEAQEASERLRAGEKIVVTPLDPQTIAGYGLVSDLDGKPAAVVQVQSRRATYQLGLNAVFTFMGWLILTNLTFILVAMVFVTRGIVAPVQSMIKSARCLAEGDVAQELHYGHRDEIGQMAGALGGIIQYMQDGSRAADQIAAGNLSLEIKPFSERDVLANSFARMVVGLRKLVRQVITDAEHLNHAASSLSDIAHQADVTSEQITHTVDQVAQGICRQSEEVDRMAAAMTATSELVQIVQQGVEAQSRAVGQVTQVTEQLSRSVEQVNTRAQMQARAARESEAVTHTSAETVQGAIQSLQRIKQKVDLSAEKVAEMGRRSDRIGPIVEIITEIASQTNLLALNAAIEAARAGESGRGFAVVADEVRRLADRSASAAKEIGDLLRGVQGIAAEAVAAMDENASEVESGVRLAGEAGHSLRGILSTADAARRGGEEIAAAAEAMNTLTAGLVQSMQIVFTVVEDNQRSVTQMADREAEINAAVDHIATISQQNSTAIQEVSVAAQELSLQAQNVNNAAQSLAEMAQIMHTAIAVFRLEA